MATQQSKRRASSTTSYYWLVSLFYIIVFLAVSCQLPTVNGQVITQLLLVNTATQKNVVELTNNNGVMVIDLDAYGGLNVNALSVHAVVATTGSKTVASVRFVVGAYTRQENSAPFALCGDEASKLTACPVLATSSLGTMHTVKATPYSGTNGKGTVGAVKQATFTLVSSRTVPVMTPITAPVGFVPFPAPLAPTIAAAPVTIPVPPTP